jgi:hypothetical protein
MSRGTRCLSVGVTVHAPQNFAHRPAARQAQSPGNASPRPSLPNQGKARAAVEAEVAAGDIHVVIGTHALLNVGFAGLGLAVIDEQHRCVALACLAL